MKKFSGTSPGFDGYEAFRYSIDSILDVESLKERLSRMASRNVQSCTVVVSDRLSEKKDGDRWIPNSLAKWTRDTFARGSNHVGLLALISNGARRISDIDLTLDASDLSRDALFDAIIRISSGLRLKIPPHGKSELDGTKAVRVHMVRSKDELSDCFALRHKVYGLMGYLESEVISTSAKIEIDAYDHKSLHFIATHYDSGESVGTLRLVLPRPGIEFRKSIVGSADRTFDQQSDWCRDIAREQPDKIFREKLNAPPAVSLPIFQSFDFRKQWDKVMEPKGAYCEVSRVVVEPKFRGLGISSLLTRAAIAAALDLQKRVILLECVPTHVSMYEKYGFVMLEGEHYRNQQVDQLAIGMKLELSRGLHGGAVSLANRDIQMIHSGKSDPKQLFGSKHLCLCNRKHCWSQGSYEFWLHQHCPLRHFHH